MNYKCNVYTFHSIVTSIEFNLNNSFVRPFKTKHAKMKSFDFLPCSSTFYGNGDDCIIYNNYELLILMATRAYEYREL